MKPLTYEAVRKDPELLQALIRQAHRERAEAVHRLLIAPIQAFFKARPKAAPVLRNRPC